MAGQRKLPLFVRCFGRTEDEAGGSWRGTPCTNERRSSVEHTFCNERLRDVAGKLSRPFAEIAKARARESVCQVEEKLYDAAYNIPY